MRVVHFADLHLDETNFEQTLPAFHFIVSWVEKERPDYVVFAGDLGIKRGHVTPTVVQRLHEGFLRIAEICRIIMIPGNHDASNSFEKVDTVFGLFGLEHGSIHERIHVCPRPEIVLGKGMQFLILPFPSRYVYLSHENNISPAQANAEIGQRLETVLAGLAADLDPAVPSMLVMHGTTEGGIAGSEMAMTTAEEIAIKRSAIPTNVDAVAAGHLHNPQEVGRIVYSGAPCPHTFGQEAQHPSFVVWAIDPDKRDLNGRCKTSFERIPIPVAHPLFTIDLGDVDFSVGPIMEVIGAELVTFQEDLVGARVRVLGSIPESHKTQLDKNKIEMALYDRGAIEVRILIEAVSDTIARADHISLEMSTDTLFDLWCDLHTDADPLRSGLKGLGKEIDAELPPEARILLRGSSYKPLRLWWHNWKQHSDGELVFDNLGRLTCITGPNTSGKSNVAEAEPFVLWKALIRGTTSLKEGIRWGETDCFCGEELELNGDRYKVVRSLSLGRGDKVKGDLVISKLQGESWLPVNWGDQRETQRKLEELVGSLDMYLATRFGSQFDIDRLLNLKPAELKDLLQEALNARIFDVRKDVGKKRVGSKETELVSVRAEIARLEEIISNKEDLEGKLRDVQVTLRETLRQIETLNSQREELVARRADVRGKIAAVETEIKRFTELEERLESALEKKAICEEAIKRLEGTLAISNVVREKVGELAALREREKDLRPKKDYVTHLEGELHALEREIQRVTAERNLTMQKVKADLANARKKFALLEDPDLNCPIGSEASCKFLADAVGAAKSIPKFEALLADLTHKAEVQKFKEEKDVGECKVVIDIAKKEAAGLEKIYAAIEVLDRGKWERKAQEIDRAETEIDRDRTRLAEVASEEVDLRKHLKAMGEPPSREALDTELRSLEKPISDLEKQIKASETSRDLSNIEIGQFKARLAACREATEKQKKLTKDEAELTGSITVLSEYVRAVSRDGLPFLLLEKALPTLQTYTNEFLGSGSSDNGQLLRVKIDPLRDLLTGEQRNEVVIWFDDEKGTHPLTEASGAQRNRLGYSLRCALARIQAEAIGCEVKLAWLDEGWGVFDQSNIVLAQGMLKRFADVFSRVIFITHVPEVKEIAETIITVVPDPKNGSTLQIS